MKTVPMVPGTVFGRLTVVEEARLPNGRRASVCRCACGQMKAVDNAKLRAGHTRSCGCLHREVAAELARTNPLIAEYRASDKRREQTSRHQTTHGLSRHPHNARWAGMMGRCHDTDHPQYYCYGARGIQVCPEWRDLATFCAWIDANLGQCPDGMSIDRINNDGNYEPGNVRWATAPQQIHNSRTAKLTMKIAEEIRRRHAAGEDRGVLAADYGVCRGTIRLVVIGETWRTPVSRPQ